MEEPRFRDCRGRELLLALKIWSKLIDAQELIIFPGEATFDRVQQVRPVRASCAAVLSSSLCMWIGCLIPRAGFIRPHSHPQVLQLRSEILCRPLACLTLEYTDLAMLRKFWFQRAAKETDLRSAVDINALLQDPSYR